MELGTVKEVELIVDQIASNKIPPPNKAQSLVIIRQMVRMAEKIEAQQSEIEELKYQINTETGSYVQQQLAEREAEIAKLREALTKCQERFNAIT